MSTYENLNKLIIARLSEHGAMKLIFLNAQEVRVECDRLMSSTGREAFRIIDGQLQKLRKAGKLEFNSKDGWKIKSPSAGSTQ
ncbi:MAG: hypothetical protein ACTS9Y_00535 [Methylophilus sp.]|uniref:hypothetical protein n=1 Tax=Methylophilus sp. TaxID=29541 RepID=UPI003FA10DCB